MPRQTKADERFWALMSAVERDDVHPRAWVDALTIIAQYVKAKPDRVKKATTSPPLRRAVEHEPGTGRGTAQFWSLAGNLLRGVTDSPRTVTTVLRDYSQDDME